MASLVVLGAIYLEDRDLSQVMKNPVAVQSTQARRKEKLVAKFRRAANFRNPCEIALPATVPTTFDFLTFLSLFGFLPNLSPCISVCCGYFGILY